MHLRVVYGYSTKINHNCTFITKLSMQNTLPLNYVR
jgi:hypothetical protein